MEVILTVLKSRKVQALVASALLVVAGYLGFDYTSEEIMSWVVANWDSILGVLGGAYGLYQRWQAARHKKEAARTARELDAIRTEAGTKSEEEKAKS